MLLCVLIVVTPLGFSIIGLGLGISGLFLRSRAKRTAVIGVCLNGGILLIIGLLVLLAAS
jgi:hypothetical protein